MRRPRHRPRGDRLPVVAIAFGAGLVTALFFSLRLTLLIAAICLIYLGLTTRCR